ncbi:MAG: nickel transporter [Burkholderiaceae bacterium]|nr:nickel transporter [Burkholderiaceae bacterium]
MNPLALQTDILALALVALLLGLRQGFDADHLAAIDGMTRFNTALRPRLARACGLLFALGHGAVVILAAVLAVTLSQAWRVPQWLESFGAWLSICLLTVFALRNLWAALGTGTDESARLAGWRSSAFARLLSVRNAGSIAGVGALFALSFDTLSLATLFALAAAQHGGWTATLLLTGLFAAGMALTDGLNGLWMSRLIGRCDQASRRASRIMAFAVCTVSLMTAALGAATQTLPQAEAWSQGKELWFSLTIVAVMLLGFVTARRLGAQGPPRELTGVPYAR